MKVLGIDPGLAFTGYACVSAASESGAEVRLHEAGVLRFDRRRTVSQRLVELQRDLEELIERTAPQGACVESLFAHYAHPRTAIIMAHARGVILLTAARARLTLFELPPAEVKKAVTGNGRASKPQVQRAVQVQLGLGAMPEPADVADAIAVALCGCRRWETLLATQDGDELAPRLAARTRGRRLRAPEGS